MIELLVKYEGAFILWNGTHQIGAMLVRTGQQAPIPDKNSGGNHPPVPPAPQAVYRQITTCYSCFSVMPSFFFQSFPARQPLWRTELQGTENDLKWVCMNYENPLFGKQNIFTQCTVRGREERGSQWRHPVSMEFLGGSAMKHEQEQVHRKECRNISDVFVDPVCGYWFSWSSWNAFTNIFWQSKHLFWKHLLGS